MDSVAQLNIISPAISVIMPTFNAASFIKEAINSVAQQTYKNWELIIVDDGSTDDTAGVVQPFVEVDTRIKYYAQANNGPGKARAFGIAKATGSLIALLDADDIWLPDKLKYSIAWISEHDADLIFHAVYKSEFIEQRESKFVPVKDAKWEGEDGLDEFLKGNPIPTLSAVFKRSSYVVAGGFGDRRHSEDYELWLRMLAAGASFYSSNTVLATYRRHPDSLTASTDVSINDCFEIFDQFVIDFPNMKRKVSNAKIYWLENYVCRYMSYARKIDTYKQYGLLNLTKQIFLAKLLRWLPGDFKRQVIKGIAKL